DGSDTSAIVKRPRCCKPLNRGYAVDFGRWCGSNGNGDGRDFANFANGVWVKTSRHKLPGVLTDRGGLRTRPLSTSLCRMPTLPSSGFPPWWCGLSLIRRTAVCGPACTVVWQGRRGDPSPYADRAEHVRQLGGATPLPNLLEGEGLAKRKGEITLAARRGLKEAW